MRKYSSDIECLPILPLEVDVFIKGFYSMELQIVWALCIWKFCKLMHWEKCKFNKEREIGLQFELFVTLNIRYSHVPSLDGRPYLQLNNAEACLLTKWKLFSVTTHLIRKTWQHRKIEHTYNAKAVYVGFQGNLVILQNGANWVNLALYAQDKATVC